MGLRENEYGLTEEDLAEIVEFFNVYRVSSMPEGVELEEVPIASSSLEVVLADMGFLLTEAELITLQEKLDPEKKGYIRLSSFVKSGAGELFRRTRLTEENAQTVFNIFDSDLDGMVRTSDLRDVLSLFGEKLSTDYLQEMLAEVDMDGDKAIGFDEFKYFAAGEVF